MSHLKTNNEPIYTFSPPFSTLPALANLFRDPTKIGVWSVAEELLLSFLFLLSVVLLAASSLSVRSVRCVSVSASC